MQRRGSCITQRRAADELDGGEDRWRRGELKMREERKLHHAVESSGGERWGEEKWRRAAEERKLQHAEES